MPGRYIIALWGMESAYGKIQGREDVVSALATLAFEGRREAFFSRELMAALQIVEQGHVGDTPLKGSLGRRNGAMPVYAELLLALRGGRRR